MTSQQAAVEVDCRPAANGWACSVTVSDDNGVADFVVSVSGEELNRYAPGSSEPSALVHASFRFLLEREPKESILGSFGLTEIERYFPEFPSSITAYL